MVFAFGARTHNLAGEKMKRIVQSVCALVCLACPAFAMATTIGYSFAADNIVASFFLLDQDGTRLWDSGCSVSDTLVWPDSWDKPATGTASLALEAGQTYTLQWVVYNNDGSNPTSADPLAFVGQFSVDGQTYLSGDGGAWKVSTLTGTAVAPVSYGLLGEDGGFWGDDVKRKVVKAIGADAAWIGLGDYPGTSGAMVVTATFTAATPAPAAALLFGSGLAVIAGLRRTRRGRDLQAP